MGKLKSHNGKFSEHYSATYIVLKKSKPFSITSSALYLQMKFFLKKEPFPQNMEWIFQIGGCPLNVSTYIYCWDVEIHHAPCSPIKLLIQAQMVLSLNLCLCWGRKVKSEQLSR